MDAQVYLSPAAPQSQVTRTFPAMPNQCPVTLLQVALPTSPAYDPGRPAPGEDYGLVPAAFCEPRAARDVPAGSLWAFLEHRTMAEVMLDEAKNRQAPAEEAA
jgi:hypothetical protein